MIEMAVTSEQTIDRVHVAIQKAQKRVFQVVAFNTRKSAIDSIQSAEGPSAPGTPPHTHRRAFLRRAILYAADAEGAVIGPRASVVGTAGQAHEFGGQYGDEVFPQRPFMRPALDKNLDRFANEWRGSVFDQ